jgi:prophage regulatory protein
MQAGAEVQLIPQPEVSQIAGISKTEIYRRMSEGRFPKSVELGPRCTRWYKPEVIAWVQARLAERPASNGEKRATNAERVVA